MLTKDGTPTDPYTYDAFISYRHVERDQKWASWLIEGLERYRIPKALQLAGHPVRLGKIFRDEDETLASADLSDQLKEALLIEEAYFGGDDNPTLSKDGFARITHVYDARGNRTEVAYFGIDGKPTLSEEGIARVTQAYDARGNPIDEAYFGIGDQLTLSKDGVAHVTRTYDARGNIVEEMDRDVNNNVALTGLKHNIPAHFKFRYDAGDRLVSTNYFDENDHQVMVEVVADSIHPDSPAEHLGLRAEDHLLSYGGQEITSIEQLVGLVFDPTLGPMRTLTFRRAGRILTIEVPAGRLGIQLGLVPGEAEAAGAPKTKTDNTLFSRP